MIKFKQAFKQRIICYVAGFILTVLIGLLNQSLGTKIDLFDMIIIPLGCSPIFGFLIYNLLINKELYKKYKSYIMFSKEGLIHFLISIIVVFVGSMIEILLGY